FSLTMTLDIQVPTKIVIMGTSSMSLNDRFSKIKPVVIPAAKQVVRPSRKSLLTSNRLTQSRSNLAVEDEFDDGLVEEELMEEEVYDPTYAAVRRTRNPAIQRQRVATIYRPVALQDRISFAPQAYRPYNNSFNHGRAGFRTYGLNRVQNGYRYNPNYGRLNNGGFQSRYQNNNNNGFPPRYGTRGRGMRGGYQKKMQPKHTPEELDRELDEYMKKPGSTKHVPITMDE
ncbi:hypothetical protein PMAYCL1PPCAC_21114, partial [Pristionchus mayeri]